MPQLARGLRELHDDHDVPDACFDRVRAHFSEADAVELTFVVGYQVFASKFAKAFVLAPPGLR